MLFSVRSQTLSPSSTMVSCMFSYRMCYGNGIPRVTSWELPITLIIYFQTTTTHSSSPTTSPDSLPLYVGVGVGGGVVVLTVVIVICVIICLRKRWSKLGGKNDSVTVSDNVMYGMRKSTMEMSGKAATDSATFQHKPAAVIYDYISTTDENGINIASFPNEAYDNVTASGNKTYGMVHH